LYWFALATIVSLTLRALKVIGCSNLKKREGELDKLKILTYDSN